jgi:preprotein translocase subunit SecA
MSLLNIIFGDANKKYLDKLRPLVDKINQLEPSFVKLSDEELKHKTLEFQERLQKGEKLDDLLPEAFATVREASKRVLSQRHFDVQLLGGIVLHQGRIAEMKTGEGKTLTSTCPIYLNALNGRGVHVVTVNDYLARRDADWMGRIYHFLGLSVGCIQNQLVSYIFKPQEEQEQKEEDTERSFKVDMKNLHPVSRPEAYKADITYGTNNEFGFDYLRDNMVQSPEEKSQRHLDYAIVDEVDSILIDEARTPLIISAPAEQATEEYYKFARLVSNLVENEDYNIDEKMRAATLTEKGIEKMEKHLGIGNIYETGGVQIVHHIEQALKARTLFKRDRDYVVKEGEVIIVDEFTGRLMHGRRYSEGLHQAIEAKEGLQIKEESRTLATITFQNLFRMYKKLAGMTGTAVTEAEEFHKIYNLEVLVIPTNKPMVRTDLSDSIYKNEIGKFKSVVKKIKELHEKGQPVLVGTISIEKNEILGDMLTAAGVPHNILNAKNHEKEAEFIAQAGKLGAVTVATNMAGRGVDIILGGNPPNIEEAKKVRELGGLVVIGTERHEARRIDNQLRGRSGRQGDPGVSQFYVSMDDDLMRIFGSDRMKAMMTTLRVPEDMPLENKLVSKAIESAQHKVEGHHFDIREHLVKYDDVINKHREVIYKKRWEVITAKEEDLRKKILELIENEIEQVVSFHTNLDDENKWDIKEIYEVTNSIFPVASDVRKNLEEIKSTAGDKIQDVESRTHLIKYLNNLAVERYKKMTGDIEDKEMIYQMEKGLYLRAIDLLWMEHLDQMAYLREGIGLRGYGQRDPLVEYKREAYQMFTELMSNIQKQLVYNIYKISNIRKVVPTVMAKAKKEIFKSEKKVGRNDPCPCGSGKKYKKCCGK